MLDTVPEAILDKEVLLMNAYVQNNTNNYNNVNNGQPKNMQQMGQAVLSQRERKGIWKN